MNPRLRQALAAVLGILSIACLLLSAVGLWVRATLTDPDRVATIAGDAVEQPEVRRELARWATDQVMGLVDVEDFVTDALPPEMERFGPLVASTIDEAVERRVDRLLARPETREVVETVTAHAHGAALQLLRGDGLVDGLTVSDGEVTINTLPILGRALTAVQDLGLLMSVEVPELSASGDPEEQIAALSAALDRDLPEDFGQMTVYRSDAVRQGETYVAQAQDVVTTAHRTLWVVVPLTLVLAAASVLVARFRSRALFLLGLSGATALLLTRWAVERVVSEAPQLVADPARQAAVVTTLTEVASSLIRITALLTAVSLVLVAVGLIRGGELRRDGSTAIGVLGAAGFIGIVGLSLVSLVVGVAVAVVLAAGLRRLTIPDTHLPAGPPT